jgi:hypothetical protein
MVDCRLCWYLTACSPLGATEEKKEEKSFSSLLNTV